jgi:hypothetical protein
VSASNPGQYRELSDFRGRQTQISDDFCAKLCRFVQVRYLNPFETNTVFGKKLLTQRNFYHFRGICHRGALLPGKLPRLATAACYHDPEQERHEQALQRRLAGNRAKPGDRLSGLLGIGDHLA